jgi:hypothetical protein
MTNLSFRGDDILLKSGHTYFIIDALYLSRIKTEFNSIPNNEYEQYIRNNIFPYSETPFSKFSLPKSKDKLTRILIRNIEKVVGEAVGATVFSTDTGIITIIEATIFLDFANAFDYDEMVDDNFNGVNEGLWSSIETKFGQFNCAIISSPGISSGLEFDGSGSYKLRIEGCLEGCL